MRPQKQAFRHDPDNGIWGDCHRTALAVLLDMDRDDVPHFGDHGVDDTTFWAHCRDWLWGQGYSDVSFIFQGHTLEDVLYSIGALNPGCYFLLAGQSRNGVNHTVIAGNGKILWDTSLDDSGIVGPCEDGNYWVTFMMDTRFRANGRHPGYNDTPSRTEDAE